MRTQSTNAFFATVNQMFGGSSQLPTALTELGSTMRFDYCSLGNIRKLGGAAEYLIDGSEKRALLNNETAKQQNEALKHHV